MAGELIISLQVRLKYEQACDHEAPYVLRPLFFQIYPRVSLTGLSLTTTTMYLAV